MVSAKAMVAKQPRLRNPTKNRIGLPRVCRNGRDRGTIPKSSFRRINRQAKSDPISHERPVFNALEGIYDFRRRNCSLDAPTNPDRRRWAWTRDCDFQTSQARGSTAGSPLSQGSRCTCGALPFGRVPGARRFATPCGRAVNCQACHSPKCSGTEDWLTAQRFAASGAPSRTGVPRQRSPERLRWPRLPSQLAGLSGPNDGATYSRDDGGSWTGGPPS